MPLANWRDAALRFLPELSDDIMESESPYMIWIYIRIKFKYIYDNLLRDDPLIERIYRFARWCYMQPRGETAEDDLLTCVFVCFYEHICEANGAVEDMPRWLTSDDFTVVRAVFKRTFTEDEYARVSRIFEVGPVGPDKRPG